MAYTLGTAATAVGAAKSTIFRAIKSGRISATKDENGQYQIEPVELFRVFNAVPADRPANGSGEQDAVTDMLVAELRKTIADLRVERDRLLGIVEQSQRALTGLSERVAIVPEPPKATPETPVKPVAKRAGFLRSLLMGGASDRRRAG